MFDFFNTRKIAALEAQLAALNEKIAAFEVETDMASIEEKINSHIEDRVDIVMGNEIEKYDFSSAIEEAMNNFNLESYAESAIESVMENATFSVRF